MNKKEKLSFEDFHLPSGLLLALYAMGFQNGPSDIQGLILPYSFSDKCERNVIVQAKTGTGKTVKDFITFSVSSIHDASLLLKISYIVHVLSRIQSISSHPQALIIVPTIELARTIGSGIEKLAMYLPNIPITYATSSRLLSESLHTPIIIGTIDMFDSFQSLIDFSQLDMLIIDEIDTMVIREDYRENLLNLIDSFPLINHCQILVYSSTLSEQVMNFTKELIPNSILIKQRADKQQLANIEQFCIQCNDEKHKFEIVNLIIEHFSQTQVIIFCADDQITEQLYERILTAKENE